MLTFEDTRENYYAEQVLAHFGIVTESNDKCVCPFHNDSDPSMHVNKQYVHCYSCDQSWDNFALALALLSREQQYLTTQDVFDWFESTTFTEVTRTYVRRKVKYVGPVPEELVQHWANNMDAEKYAQLEQERLINKATAWRFKIGWREDYAAWTLPFYVNGKADIVQFRMTGANAKSKHNKVRSKYVGLKGHSRGSFMNADILQQERPYVVIFFGSFDAMLAQQDGLWAVGSNGSNPFTVADEDRVRKLFEKQWRVFVVPDNTPQEYKSATKLAEMLGGKVRYFSAEAAPDTDYISYRKAGGTSRQFMNDVLRIGSDQEIKGHIPCGALEHVLTGDSHSLLIPYLELGCRGTTVSNLAREMALCRRPASLSKEQWKTTVEALETLGTTDDLKELAQQVRAMVCSNGGW